MKDNDQRPGHPPGNRRAPYRIAVVDRSPSVRRAVQMAFPPPLFQTQAYARRQDFEDGGDQIPEAIFIGLSLPEKGGYALARDLKDRADFNHVPMFLLRGAFEPVDDRATGQMDGEAIIITEPFDSARLRRRVRESIESRRDPESLPEDPDPPDQSRAVSNLDDELKDWVEREIRELEARIERKLMEHFQEVKSADSPGEPGDPEP